MLIFLTTLLAALHSRVLVNDWLGTRLAEMVGLRHYPSPTSLTYILGYLSTRLNCASIGWLKPLSFINCHKMTAWQ